MLKHKLLRHHNLLFGFALGIVLAQTACQSQPTSTPTAPLAPTAQLLPTMAASHVPMGETVTYDQFPPNSGVHWPQWVNAGLYAETVRPELYIHNLEHGYQVVLFDCTTHECPENLRTELQTWYQSLPKTANFDYAKVVVSPADRLPTLLVALGWGQQLNLTTLDIEALTAFYPVAGKIAPESVAP